MAAKGLLNGFETVGDYVGNKENLAELQSLLEQEIFPSLEAPLDVLQTYAQQVIDRFKNPFVSHRLSDISLNSVAKFKSRLLPVFEFHLQKTGALPAIASLGMVALVLNYLRFPERIRDTAEVKSYFAGLDPDLSEIDRVTMAIRDLFGLEDPNGIAAAYLICN
jgi:tagaturonate reductase